MSKPLSQSEIGLLSFRRSSLIFLLPILLLFVLGAFLRLFDLTDQPIDFHPTRQLRGAIVARGIYYSFLPSAGLAAEGQEGQEGWLRRRGI